MIFKQIEETVAKIKALSKHNKEAKFFMEKEVIQHNISEVEKFLQDKNVELLTFEDLYYLLNDLKKAQDNELAKSVADNFFKKPVTYSNAEEIKNFIYEYCRNR